MKDQQHQAKQRRGRIIITVFFLGLLTVCFAGTRLLVPQLRTVRAESAHEMPVWKCIEIFAGNHLRATDDSVTNRIWVRGIDCPPTARGSELDKVAASLGMREEDLIRKGQLAQKTLTAWIYRRRARLDNIQTMDNGDVTADVIVGGVDVARKMLQNGQAYVIDTPHERLEEMRAYEKEARNKEIGIWRR